MPTLFELHRIEAELAGAYESACLAAETLEVPPWEELGAKIAAALADVRAGLAAAKAGPEPSSPRSTAGRER